mmetsp:Transcript_345/g.359  ORF Transcript_345/g.359 Transcript_345/m.359 type:complete len:193 (+) Transcript_345:123-701(+)
MKQQNRPLGATDITRGLKDLTRLQINKAIEKLVQEELLVSKENKIYWVSQQVFGEATEERSSKLNATVKRLESTFANCSARQAAIQQQTNRISSEPSDKELESDLQKYRKQVLECSGKIESVKENHSGVANQAESQHSSEELTLRIKYFRSQWKSRRLAVMDVLLDMKESMPPKTKLEKMCQDIGVELDKKK